MDTLIETIYLSAEQQAESSFDYQQGNTDVIVLFENGDKYVASFFSYANLELIHRQHQESGDYLNGAYFWTKNMVLVLDCSMEKVRQVVDHLLDEGEFREVFQKI